MTDNEITREKTFSEELPHFKERIKEVFDNYNNPNGNEDPLYICVLRDSKRVVRKAEEEINRQQEDIEMLQYLLDEEEKKYTICAKHFYKEAIKEFAERLKTEYAKGMDWFKKKETYYVDVGDIDNLLKELVGENDAR